MDITHHSALTEEEILKIENAANTIVENNISVKIENFDRNTAEQKYGFRIYQGGVVPVKSVRIVSIGDLDVEACGGTHVKKTSDIEQVKITKTKRIQDGVVRIEFVSGSYAKEFSQKKEQHAKNKQVEQKIKEEQKEKRLENRQLVKEKIPTIVNAFSDSKQGVTNIDKITVVITEQNNPNFCFSTSNDYDDIFHIKLGESLCKEAPNLVYFGLFDEGEKIRIKVYCGEKISKIKKAGDIVKDVSEMLGGAGGGGPNFAQGGGKDKSKKDEAVNSVKSMILN